MGDAANSAMGDVCGVSCVVFILHIIYVYCGYDVHI